MFANMELNAENCTLFCAFTWAYVIPWSLASCDNERPTILAPVYVPFKTGPFVGPSPGFRAFGSQGADAPRSARAAVCAKASASELLFKAAATSPLSALKLVDMYCNAKPLWRSTSIAKSRSSRSAGAACLKVWGSSVVHSSTNARSELKAPAAPFIAEPRLILAASRTTCLLFRSASLAPSKALPLTSMASMTKERSERS
mmetsp:Transcript_20798/g.58587  ORF Transcript_20798/g.58587 Transcript_20798/m.58587 type:complete len:201 (+) Transcript_20798:921-1523(+)